MPYPPRNPGDSITLIYAATMQRSVVDPEVRSRLGGMGVSAVECELARPEALRAHLRNEIETLGIPLVRAGGQGGMT